MEVRSGVRGARRPVLRPYRGDQARNTDQSDGPSDIIGERGQAELAANVLEPAHQERALTHPLFDGAEGVLDAVSPVVKHLGPGRQPRRHAVENGLVLQTRDAAE